MYNPLHKENSRWGKWGSSEKWNVTTVTILTSHSFICWHRSISFSKKYIVRYPFLFLGFELTFTGILTHAHKQVNTVGCKLHNSYAKNWCTALMRLLPQELKHFTQVYPNQKPFTLLPCKRRHLQVSYTLHLYTEHNEKWRGINNASKYLKAMRPTKRKRS